MDERWTLYRWRPRWRLARWVVFVEEWCVRPLDGMAWTTGACFDVSPFRWIWIRFLGLLLASRSETVRAFAGRRWDRMRVIYRYPRGLVSSVDWSLAEMQTAMLDGAPGDAVTKGDR